MAYALVGSFGTVATGTNSCSPTFAQTTTANNLVVCLAASAAGSTNIANDQSWSTAFTVVGAGTERTAVFYKVAAGSDTAPVISATSAGTIEAVLAEFSGGATSSPIDKTDTTSGTTSPIVAVPATADVAAAQLLVTTGSWSLSKAGTCTTANTFNNGATPTNSLSNDATSAAHHYRFAWGVTTGNASPTQTSQSNDSMNLGSGVVGIATFLLATTARQPRNSAINHQNPAVLMEGMEQDKRNHLWLPKRKIWRPGIALPTPATI